MTARALFLAAAAEGTTTLRHPLLSDDTDGFAQGLSALGYDVRFPEFHAAFSALRREWDL